VFCGLKCNNTTENGESAERQIQKRDIIMIRDIILKNRSYRRFKQTPISRKTLEELIDLARLSPSAANKQPLKYILSCSKRKNNQIFPKLAWAGYLTDWPGPAEDERPTAYIVVLCDTEISKSVSADQGIASQSILLGAVEKGLGGCIIASVHKQELRKALDIPPQYDILFVIALGEPKETVVLETVGADGDIKYWRDKNSVHHVPKRKLKDIIVS